MGREFSVSAMVSLSMIVVGGAAAVLFAKPGFASHHFETELSKMNPLLDLTDLYVFESDRKGYTAVVLKFNPTAKAEQWADAFPSNGYVSVHFGADKTMSSGVTYNFTFADDKVTMHRADEAVPELGDLGDVVGSGAMNSTVEIGDSRVWTGVGPDPFAGNGKGLTLYRDAAEKGEFLKDAYKDGEDLFGTFEASMISFDVPNSELPNELYYYGSSAIKDGDAWKPINRIGFVLMPHIFLRGEDYMKIINGAPADDPVNIVKVAATLEKWVSVADNVADPKAYSMEMAKKLMPDVVPYVPGTPASYSTNIDNINGRRVNDDAMNVAVTWMTGGAISDDNSYIKPDRVSAYFPFVVGTSAK